MAVTFDRLSRSLTDFSRSLTYFPVMTFDLHFRPLSYSDLWPAFQTFGLLSSCLQHFRAFFKICIFPPVFGRGFFPLLIRQVDTSQFWLTPTTYSFKTTMITLHHMVSRHVCLFKGALCLQFYRDVPIIAAHFLNWISRLFGRGRLADLMTSRQVDTP